MAAPETIPAEIRARVEANAFFDALTDGDYASAAQAQDRLRSFGWHLNPVTARARPTRRAKRNDAIGREVPVR
jgi:hypothetical protein